MEAKDTESIFSDSDFVVMEVKRTEKSEAKSRADTEA